MTIEPYFHVQPGKSCLYASFAAVLRYYGYNLTESDVFFLCKGMSIRLSVSSLHKEISMPNQFFEYRSAAHIIQHTADLLNLQFQHGNDLSNPKTFQTIREELNRENPVIIFLSPHRLKYVPREFNPDAEQELHCVILYGLNEQATDGFIADSYVVDNSGRVSVYTGALSCSVIQNDTKEFIYICRSFPRLIHEKVIRNRVIENLTDYTNVSLHGETITGISAIYHCIKQATAVFARDNSCIRQYLLELSYLLKAHFIIFFDYLLDYLNHLLPDFPEDLFAAFRTLRNRWSNYCMKIWQNSLRPVFSSKWDMISVGNNLLNQTIDLLTKIRNQLLSVPD